MLQKESRQVRREADLVALGELPLVDTDKQRLAAGGKDSDIDDDADAEGTQQLQGESRRVMLWIWTTTGTAGTDVELEDALRIEWCKAYARVRRWREEVHILQEEW
ncbi:hypothetical protein C8F01DRAFT_1258585 [Mycena amicta]|nr:hypothetical protein C8F01DRAFT_1258585 [Mycena amicta]